MGAAKLDTAYTAVDSAIDVVGEIKAKLVAASEAGVDKTKLQRRNHAAAVAALQRCSVRFVQRRKLGQQRRRHGQRRFVLRSRHRRRQSRSRPLTTRPSALTSTLFDGTTQGGILGATRCSSGSSIYGFIDRLQHDPGRYRQPADGRRKRPEEHDDARFCSSVRSRPASTSRPTSSASLSDSIDSGIGRLVDANMEEESSKLSALQTQQQLAIQSLSIANSSSQNILSLFRG